MLRLIYLYGQLSASPPKPAKPRIYCVLLIFVVYVEVLFHLYLGDASISRRCFYTIYRKSHSLETKPKKYFITWWNTTAVTGALFKDFHLLHCYRHIQEQDHLVRVMWKCVFGHIQTAKTHISLRIRAVWSGPSMSVNRTTGYYWV